HARGRWCFCSFVLWRRRGRARGSRRAAGRAGFGFHGFCCVFPRTRHGRCIIGASQSGEGSSPHEHRRPAARPVRGAQVTPDALADGTTADGYLLVLSIIFPVIGILLSMALGGRHVERIALIFLLAGLAVAIAVFAAIL